MEPTTEYWLEYDHDGKRLNIGAASVKALIMDYATMVIRVGNPVIIAAYPDGDQIVMITPAWHSNIRALHRASFYVSTRPLMANLDIESNVLYGYLAHIVGDEKLISNILSDDHVIVHTNSGSLVLFSNGDDVVLLRTAFVDIDIKELQHD